MNARHIRVEFGFGVGFSADGLAIPADVREGALRDIRRRFLDEFGAYTELETSGGWINPKSQCEVVEPGRTFWVVTPEKLGLAKQIEDLRAYVKHCLSQDSVCVTEFPVSFTCR